MTDKRTMTNYLSFIYKFRSFMDDVCPKIVDQLNREYKGKKKDSFILDEPTIFFNKKTPAFTGYYIKYKNDYSIYVGINYNLTKLFWVDVEQKTEEKEARDKELKERTDEFEKYFISVDIKTDHCIDSGKAVEDSKPIKVNWEKDKNEEQWVYFNIPNGMLKSKEGFIKRVVDIIKTNLSME